jgi:hypothetical protein
MREEKGRRFEGPSTWGVERDDYLLQYLSTLLKVRLHLRGLK